MKHSVVNTLSADDLKLQFTIPTSDIENKVSEFKTNNNSGIIKQSNTQTQIINNEENKNRTQKNTLSNIKYKILKIFSYVTVEPILCFYVFPQLLSQIAVYNLQFQTACRVNLALNETICDDLLSVNNTEYELLVEKEAAKLMVWKKPLSTLVPAVLILFMGSYSDRYKIRKPFLLLPLVGEVLISICFLLCTAFKTVLPMEAVAGSEAIFTAITGGLTTVKIAVYSYVSDVSSTEMRTTRLGIVQILSSIMTPLAFAISGVLFTAVDFYGVFTIRTFIFAVGIFYGVFVIKETTTKKECVKSKSDNFCKDFFDLKNVKDTFNALIRKRDNNKRAKIFLMLVAFIIVKGANAGEMEILFMYTRLKFQWNEITYGLFITYDIVLRLIGSTVAILVFTQWLKLDDLIVTPITFLSKIIGSCICAFCPSEAYFYFASVVSLMNDYQTVPIRSLATKLVEGDELGKIQSLFGICDAIAPSIYVPLYSAVYRSTVDYLPGAFYLAGAGGLIPFIPAFLVLYLFRNKDLKTTEELDIKPDTIKYIIPINDLS